MTAGPSPRLERATSYVGVLTVEFDTPFVTSLKEKRSLIMPITEKLKARYPLSVARLDGLDSHDREVIGAAAISADRQWLEGMLAKALRFVEGRGVPLRASSIEVEVWDAAG